MVECIDGQNKEVSTPIFIIDFVEKNCGIRKCYAFTCFCYEEETCAVIIENENVVKGGESVLAVADLVKKHPSIHRLALSGCVLEDLSDASTLLSQIDRDSQMKMLISLAVISGIILNCSSW